MIYYYIHFIHLTLRNVVFEITVCSLAQLLTTQLVHQLGINSLVQVSIHRTARYTSKIDCSTGG